MADLARYAIAAGVTLTVGVVMGYRPGGGVPGVLAGAVLAVITGWSIAWIFMWTGTKARNAGAVQGMSMVIMFPLAFLPTRSSPLTPTPDGCRP
jgi:ABC-2 type transport system permease protein